MSPVPLPGRGAEDAEALKTLVHRYRAALERIEELYRVRGEMLLGARALKVRHAEMAEWCGLRTRAIGPALDRLRHQGVEARPLSNPEAELRGVASEIRAAQREALELRHDLHLLITRLLEEGWTVTTLTVATGFPEHMLRRYRNPYVGRSLPVGSSRGYRPR